MARLYSAFDALGLGDAINRNQQRRLQNSMAINKLFADGIGNLGTGIYEKAVDEKARENALAAARNVGLENADELSNSMSGADFAKYVLGYQDKLGDEGRAETRDIEAEERADLRDIEKRNRDFADFLDRNAVTSQQALRNSVLGQLFGNLGNVTVKDYGNSKQGKIDRENAVNAIVDFFNDDEKMQGTIRQLLTKGLASSDGSEPWWDEDQLDEANAIIKSDSKAKGKDVESFIQKLETNNQLESFQKKNPGTWRELLRNADKSTQKKHIRSGDLGKGVTSEKEADDKAAKEAWARKKQGVVDGSYVPTPEEEKRMVAEDPKLANAIEYNKKKKKGGL